MKYLLILKQKVFKDCFSGKDGIRGLEHTHGVSHQLLLSWIKTCQKPSSRMRQGKALKEAALHLDEPPVFADPNKELAYLRAENAYLCKMFMLIGVRKNG